MALWVTLSNRIVASRLAYECFIEVLENDCLPFFVETAFRSSYGSKLALSASISMFHDEPQKRSLALLKSDGRAEFPPLYRLPR